MNRSQPAAPRSRSTRGPRPTPPARRALLPMLAAVVGASAPAEDADWARPYLNLQRGELNHRWGVQDMWELGFGWNLDRHWGVELNVATWETILEPPSVGSTVGEESVVSVGVQGRYRYPLCHDRLVPYAVAGLGGASHQFNDRKSAGFGRDLDAEATGFVARFGMGIEYFVADNIAVGLEGKYHWFDPVDLAVDGQVFEYDASDWTVTIGMRLYLAENRPRPPVTSDDDGPIRLYFGGQAGGSFLADDARTGRFSIQEESSAWAGTVNPDYGLRFGANFGPHWGVEVTGDGGEYTIIADGIGAVGELAVVTAIPQLRWSWPLGRGRWVPYVMGGVGIAYAELNDLKPASAGHTLDAGGISPAAAVGGGLEWFIARNLSFSLQSQWKQVWGQSATIDGVETDGDFSQVQVLIGFRAYLLEWGGRSGGSSDARATRAVR